MLNNMKNIAQYVIESIDDNINYKIETWFADDEDNRIMWDNTISKFREQHSVEGYEELYDKIPNVNKFVDFCGDNVEYGKHANDYKDMFLNICKSQL